MVVVGPALTTGIGWIVMFNVIGPAEHPRELYEVTLTVPLPAPPQFTWMMFVPCPEVIVPPVTVHENEVPLDAVTL